MFIMTLSPDMSAMPDTDTSYSVSTPHTWPQPVMPVPTFPVMPDLIGHHSFFNASAGLVRAALRVCQRTEAREIAKADTAARTYIHGF